MMTQEDYPAFDSALSGFAGIFGRRLPPDTVELYFALLRDIPWPNLKAAIESLARRIEVGGRLPTPRELRSLVSDSRAPTDPLTDVQRERISSRVYEDLAAWEAAHFQGTARPVFDTAWHEALREVVPGSTAVHVRDREHCWQQWLQASPPLQSENFWHGESGG